MKELINTIVNEVRNVQNEQFEKKKILKNTDHNNENHEFLFFIKPEITIADNNIKLNEILSFIFEKLNEYKLKIKDVNILSAKYLDKTNIMAQHYGIINQLSQNPKTYFSETAVQNFQKVFNKSINDVNLLGSLELMKHDDSITLERLEELVSKIEIIKLSGGTYVQKVLLNGADTYIINSFHPKQLLHFIKPGRSIVTFTLQGNTDWQIARTDLIGSTNPSVAKDGSIRKELFVNKATFGLADISYSLNGVHLSAGPVEGLIELMRFNSDFENKIKPDLLSFKMGQLLNENFTEKQIDIILLNPDVEYNKKTQSIFDITEEKNNFEAIKILKSLKI
ncbi:MAG TPA: hypothetical protein DDX39_08690 [Bacteroidales bacterium]|nr:MAG: hypothetical protein A2W98_04705 [Bacteroidetes bacterium GWF2_33_38]OFY72278.1 MAG: hypothetical protein A2265_05845 [Bacteroidetes bacterium RIFOXYA12_FULL_33_9]HBF88704.1 hypothetical protein [Bacteroidales bacterium]